MSDIELDYDDNLDPDIYLNDEELENSDKDYLPNKNKFKIDNDDNENDYINGDDQDLNDETYEYEEDEDYDDEMEDDELNSHKVSFIDHELDNDSKIQFIIKNDDKITSNILTIYEVTELIGIRATQISNGSPTFTNMDDLADPIEMAKKELLDNKFPLYVKRYIGLDKYELWDPNVMVKPKF